MAAIAIRRGGFTSTPAEPVVALILPIPAGILVGDEHLHDVLRVLEPELRRYAQLHREAVLGRQDLVGVAEGEQRLRMQRGGHIDARVVVVGALEADVLRRGVRADTREELAETHPAPLADRAPALDADVARDLRGLRQ